MQTILVLKIHNFPSVLETYGVDAVNMVYEMRKVALSKLSIFRYFGESIAATVKNVQEATNIGHNIIDTLCSEKGCIHISGAIGWGELYPSADGDYWGIELNKTIELVDKAYPKSISLTKNALSQTL